jgi:hypothetical protein
VPTAPNQGAPVRDGDPEPLTLPVVLEGGGGVGGAAPEGDTLPHLSSEEVALGVAAELAVAEADDLVAATASFRVWAGRRP